VAADCVEECVLIVLRGPLGPLGDRHEQRTHDVGAPGPVDAG